MKHLLHAVLLAVLLLPGTVHAYVEPEDVLFGNDDVLTDDDLHSAASSRSSRAASSVSSEDDLHSAAPDGEYLTPREERILQRIENRQTSSAPTVHVPSDDVLHSGAPLAHTGPETIIALALLGIAVAATVVFARSGHIEFPEN